MTRKLQAVGNHFAPFFEALSDAIADDGDSPGSMALVVLLRILLIASCILAAYAFARILNMVLGGDIVVEQQVIIVDEDEDDDKPDADDNGEEHEAEPKKKKKKVTRSKKQK